MGAWKNIAPVVLVPTTYSASPTRILEEAGASVIMIGGLLAGMAAPSDLDGNGIGDNCDPWADVPMDYWARSSIDTLYEAGVTVGCSTDPLRFCPEGALTRAEMATFLLRAVGGSAGTRRTASRWAASAVALTGLGSTSFSAAN